MIVSKLHGQLIILIIVVSLVQRGFSLCHIFQGWYYSAERFLSVHNCVLVIMSAERFLYTISYIRAQRVSLCAILILQNSECREVSLHIFSLGVNQRGFSLVFGEREVSVCKLNQRGFSLVVGW